MKELMHWLEFNISEPPEIQTYLFFRVSKFVFIVFGEKYLPSDHGWHHSQNNFKVHLLFFVFLKMLVQDSSVYLHCC